MPAATGSEILCRNTFRLCPLLATAVAALSCCWSAEANGEDAPRYVAGQVNVADFGAKGDGKTDDTEAFQKAIDAVTNSGGKVIVPVGRFRIEGSVRIKDGVTVAGLNESSLAPGPLKGTVILDTGGRDHEVADPLFEMESSSALRGLTIFYPE